MNKERKQPSAFLVQMREEGRIPDDIWYQINGKSFDENFVEIANKQSRKNMEFMRARREKQLKERAEKQKEKEREKELEEEYIITIKSEVKKK